MQQPDLFTGDDLRDEGIQRAERDRALVMELIDDRIDYLARFGDAFTAETVRKGFGPNIQSHADISKVIGGRIRAAATRGTIFTLGETVTALRPSAHSRRMLVWYGKGAA